MNTNHRVPFTKPSLSVAEQIALLKKRGLIFSDENLARHHLTFITYYRFCGYGIPFEEPNVIGEKRYKTGTKFEDIMECYDFDRKLRLLVIDAIERIEISIRTVITNELATKHGPHWYLNKRLFLKEFKHKTFIAKIKKGTLYKPNAVNKPQNKQERFFQHYYNKYSEPKFPPIWMVGEVISLGTWSLMYSNFIDRQNQKNISKHFGINHLILESWLHTLTYLRNLCSHHNMLLNRRFNFTPKISKDFEHQLKNNSKFAAFAAIIKIILDVISLKSDWCKKLKDLISSYPNVDINKLGFNPGWKQDLFWQ
jgi:abortive infection bacteriophage resistance protein